MRSVRVVGLLICIASGALAACGDGTGPQETGPPYLAIVAKVLPGSRGAVGTSYTYRVRELSGTLGIEDSVTAGPTDTVILSLPPATYLVELGQGVPSTCTVRDEGRALIVLDSTTNTGLVRFFLSCREELTIAIGTDGQDLDSAFIYTLASATGEWTGLLGPNDTIGIGGVPAGDYTLRLHNVAPNCVVTSHGGARQRITIGSTGGATAAFRVVCSREADRPQILSFAASAHDGAAAFFLRVVDPNADVDGYHFDLTDCAGTSVLPGGLRSRGNLTGSRIGRQDTAVIVAGFEIPLDEVEAMGRCAAMRVTDYYGNTTAITEVPFASGGYPPTVTSFNARWIGTTAIRTQLAASDGDSGSPGIFALARLRDGILSLPDGSPDIGVFNAVGYLTLPLPDVPLGNGRPAWDDYYAIILYVIDDSGRFTRVEDADLSS